MKSNDPRNTEHYTPPMQIFLPPHYFPTPVRYAEVTSQPVPNVKAWELHFQ